MCLMLSRRRSFFVHCPICGKLLDKSENERSFKVCDKCRSELKVSLIPGLLLIKFDSKKLKSPDFDGTPEHDRRHHEQAVFL